MKLQDLEYIKEVIDSLVVSEEDYTYGPNYALEVDKQRLASTMLKRMIRECKYQVNQEPDEEAVAEVYEEGEKLIILNDDHRGILKHGDRLYLKQKPMSDVEIAKLLGVSVEWFLKSDLTKLKKLVRLVEQHHGIGE